MTIKLTQLEFEEKVHRVHGDNIDLSEAVYVNNRTKVVVTCRRHAHRYEVTPTGLFASLGCQKCKGESLSQHKSKGYSGFVECAVAVHGDSYSYGLVEYINNKTPVKIICNRHNVVFNQCPDAHLAGKGCRLCANEAISDSKKKTRDWFIKEVSGCVVEDYDYSLSEYTGYHSKIDVGCKAHGTFRTTPASLLSGKRCPMCSKQKVADDHRMSLSEFTDRANKIHSNSYDYSLVQYLNAQTKVRILCTQHGEFLQAPAQHLIGQGCPQCAAYGFDVSRLGVVYVLNICGVFNFTGFGITCGSKVRLAAHSKALRAAGCFIYEQYISTEMTGASVQELEKVIKQTFPLAACSRDIPGFKRESTTADYATVVAFVEDYITKNKQETTWQHST